MKRKPRLLRLTTHDWLLAASPFPVLWLHIGLSISPAVFTPWVMGQHINTLDAMSMWALATVFPVVYFPFLLGLSPESKITLKAVIISSIIALVAATILTPIP